MEIAGRDTGMVAGRHRPSGQRRPIDRLFRLQTPRFWGGTGPGGCWPDPTLIFFCQKRGESTRKAPVIGPALLFSKTPTRGSRSASLVQATTPGVGASGHAPLGGILPFLRLFPSLHAS